MHFLILAILFALAIDKNDSEMICNLFFDDLNISLSFLYFILSSLQILLIVSGIIFEYFFDVITVCTIFSIDIGVPSFTIFLISPLSLYKISNYVLLLTYKLMDHWFWKDASNKLLNNSLTYSNFISYLPYHMGWTERITRNLWLRFNLR